MSSGYADRLKEYPNKGVCGLPEKIDTDRIYQRKLKELVSLIQTAQYVVCLTGAGISTAARIPDFRGPNGIWTLEQQKNRKRKRDSRKQPVSFADAQPTYTHRAITQLVDDQVLHFCVTQNVDGLHRRSGLSREHHAVLHGCVFTELCEECNTEYFRDEVIDGMSFQKTGNTCLSCNGALRDTMLDWEDPLPEYDYERAQQQCAKADLTLCLGTSLRINPAGQLPLSSKKFVVVNLQETPFDGQATLVIRQRVDRVFTDLMTELGRSLDDKPVPQIERYWKMPRVPDENGDEADSDSESPYR